MTNEEAILMLDRIMYDEDNHGINWATGAKEAFNMAISALKKQIPQKTQKDLQPTCNQLATDCISRQAAIDAIKTSRYLVDAMEKIIRLPSAQPTLYGYNVEHLIMIAEVLRKENMPPERVAEALTDIGRIVAIVRDEFEKSFRKAVEQCMT